MALLASGLAVIIVGSTLIPANNLLSSKVDAATKPPVKPPTQPPPKCTNKTAAIGVNPNLGKEYVFVGESQIMSVTINVPFSNPSNCAANMTKSFNTSKYAPNTTTQVITYPNGQAVSRSGFKGSTTVPLDVNIDARKFGSNFTGCHLFSFTVNYTQTITYTDGTGPSGTGTNTLSITVCRQYAPFLLADSTCKGATGQQDFFDVTANDDDAPTSNLFGVTWELQTYNDVTNKWDVEYTNVKTPNLWGNGSGNGSQFGYDRRHVYFKKPLPDVTERHRISVWTDGYGQPHVPFNHPYPIYANEYQGQTGLYEWGPCRPLKTFKLTPTVTKPVLNNKQAPTSVNFSGHVSSDASVTIKNVPVTRSFYVIRASNGAKPHIVPDRTNTYNIPSGSPGSLISDPNVLLTAVAPVLPGDQICETISTPSGGTVDGNGKIKKLNGPPPITSTPICAIVTVSSYFSVYGGDVFAGVSGTCGPGWANSTSAGIYAFRGWQNNAAKANLGAGGEAGVFALGPINDSGIYGFMSARLRTSFPIPQTDLTFANTNGL
ncbi:MAG TPA: hypothetical protein VLF39_03690, partial [Candidatus Saccharimonadales bacterium]|nr:hypothetical protein [Candidatus Saccharimonadales bacterium]